MRDSAASIDNVSARAYRIPTDLPESDGTIEWTSTTLVVAYVSAGGRRGLGYTYGHSCAAPLIADKLAPLLQGRDAFAGTECWDAMVRAVRNIGAPGICSMAISAVDSALWDLKGKLLNTPLVSLLGQARQRVPVYGSGGFTSYSIAQLQKQLGDWIDAGLPWVKMKIGRHPDDDVPRVQAVRAAIGERPGIFVDANGAYTRKFALRQALALADLGVTWYEEPLSSEDLSGLKLLRDRAPAGMELTAGEYGYDSVYFRRMCAAGAVDVLQADATRCKGITGFLRAAAIADAFLLPLSSHCAPSLHLHACCAAPRVRHMEYFHDHVRIEQMLFDGALSPVGGEIAPDLGRPGLGLELKEADAQPFAV
ncbi:MAG TPA: enolase C-terminal domain-like protein [Steroidobacteraceae bacterium]|nr:enolase C-terminal domain-like protein [Steroidobacteraceae bacterium]